MQLTPHFSLSEFACKCGCGQAKVNLDLPHALEELREATGPITITSGYRCPQHRVERGKVRPGMHTRGIAADIRVKGMTARELYEIVKLFPRFRGVGVDDEQNYVHVDLRETPARWCYSAGRDVPWFERAA